MGDCASHEEEDDVDRDEWAEFPSDCSQSDNKAFLERVGQAFGTFDLQKPYGDMSEGRTTFDSLKAAAPMAALNCQLSDDELRKFIRGFDKDESGDLDSEELRLANLCIKLAPMAAFGNGCIGAWADQTGTVSFEGMCAVQSKLQPVTKAITPEQLQAAMVEFDHDKDGVLNEANPSI